MYADTVFRPTREVSHSHALYGSLRRARVFCLPEVVNPASQSGREAARKSEQTRKKQTGRHSMKLPWEPDCRPLMLAPMQGVTNRALRALFIIRVRHDVVFTEFVRAQADIQNCISDSDRREIDNRCNTTPLVVQLIGSNIDFLVAPQIGRAHV